MVKSILTLATIGLLALPSAVRGQSGITGKWQGKTPNGFQLELDLVATENNLTGTFTRDGHSLAIAEGKVSKNTLTFTVTMNDQSEGFTGEVNGDQMKLWMDRQGPSAAAALKRADARLVADSQGFSRYRSRPAFWTTSVSGSFAYLRTSKVRMSM